MSNVKIYEETVFVVNDEMTAQDVGWFFSRLDAEAFRDMLDARG